MPDNLANFLYQQFKFVEAFKEFLPKELTIHEGLLGGFAIWERGFWGLFKNPVATFTGDSKITVHVRKWQGVINEVVAKYKKENPGKNISVGIDY